MNDPRITSFQDRNETAQKTKLVNGMTVGPMEPFDPLVPANHQDQYHMYTHAGKNASNTSYHHKFSDVTVFHSKTSPLDHQDNKVTDRYIIIVDQWTGARLRVDLPPVTDEQISQSKKV